MWWRAADNFYYINNYTSQAAARGRSGDGGGYGAVWGFGSYFVPGAGFGDGNTLGDGRGDSHSTSRNRNRVNRRGIFTPCPITQLAVNERIKSF